MRSPVQQLLTLVVVLALTELSRAATLPLENGDIHDIHGPIALPEPLTWLYYVAAVLIILALLIIWFIVHRKRKPQTVHEIPIHETALAELARARKYLEQNLSLKYAQKASLILRNYLERRFDIHSTRQTTTEFLASFDQLSSSSQAMLQPYRQSLQICLEQFDLAKYAHKTTEQETMEQLEESIRNFIQETTPKESE
jgi:hypothetical protein